jgi:hypothetical protein
MGNTAATCHTNQYQAIHMAMVHAGCVVGPCTAIGLLHRNRPPIWLFGEVHWGAHREANLGRCKVLMSILIETLRIDASCRRTPHLFLEAAPNACEVGEKRYWLSSMPKKYAPRLSLSYVRHLVCSFKHNTKFGKPLKGPRNNHRYDDYIHFTDTIHEERQDAMQVWTTMGGWTLKEGVDVIYTYASNAIMKMCEVIAQEKSNRYSESGSGMGFVQFMRRKGIFVLKNGDTRLQKVALSLMRLFMLDMMRTLAAKQSCEMLARSRVAEMLAPRPIRFR